MIEVIAEAKEIPRWVQQRIARAGGYNILGEPNFRLVWGWNRLTAIAGQWDDHATPGDATTYLRTVYEVRQVPKYTDYFCYHIERWISPEEMGSPEAWQQSMTETGDDGIERLTMAYPSLGEYESCYLLQPTELTPTVVDYLVRVVLRSRILVKQRPTEAFDAKLEREKKKEKEWSDHADGVLGDTDAAFAGAPFSAPSPRPLIHP